MNKTPVDWDAKQDLFEKLIKEGAIEKPVIEEIYKISHELYERSERQRENIEAKAETLIKTLGLIITLILGAVGLLTKNFISGESFRLNYVYFSWIIVFFAIAIGFLLYVVRNTMKIVEPISEYRDIDPTNVFQDEIAKSGELRYKLFMSIHFWKIFNKNKEANEYKGKRLKKSFSTFCLSLVAIFILTIASLCAILASWH